jgi:3'-phosphoadenosine 5'-phosphosulfate sulfotransferase (PAPS reductase)/FAD synthetase
MERKKVFTAAWSGGKDSTYMVNELLKRGDRLDEVIFCDTGHEFEIMYEYIEKIKAYWEAKYCIKITLINWKKGKEVWDRYAETPFTKGQFKGQKRGFPFHMGMSWCTRELKVNPMKKYLAENYEGCEIIEYVGIAYNEPDRIRDTGEIYPLYEWKITEDEIASSLVEQGLHNPLYNHFHRTGCFNCPKQSLSSLYKLYKHYNKEWEYIKQTQTRYTEEGAGVNLFKGYTW